MEPVENCDVLPNHQEFQSSQKPDLVISWHTGTLPDGFPIDQRPVVKKDVFRVHRFQRGRSTLAPGLPRGLGALRRGGRLKMGPSAVLLLDGTALTFEAHGTLPWHCQPGSE